MNENVQIVPILLEMKADMGRLEGKVDSVLELHTRVSAIEKREQAQARKVGVLAGLGLVLGYFSAKLKALFG